MVWPASNERKRDLEFRTLRYVTSLFAPYPRCVSEHQCLLALRKPGPDTGGLIILHEMPNPSTLCFVELESRSMCYEWARSRNTSVEHRNIVGTGGVSAAIVRVNDRKQVYYGFAACDAWKIRCLADALPSCLIHLTRYIQLMG